MVLFLWTGPFQSILKVPNELAQETFFENVRSTLGIQSFNRMDIISPRRIWVSPYIFAASVLVRILDLRW